MRDIMQQQESPLADSPLLVIDPTEPMDLEELEMRAVNGEQFNRSMDAEMAIDLAFFENNYVAIRRAMYEDLFDFGVAGLKDWLGDDNHAKFRRCDPNNVVISYCKNSTFEDIIHAGEIISVPLIELATAKNSDGDFMFDEKELQDFAGSIAGKFGNPVSIGSYSSMLKPYDKFKCQVLDLEFYTYNNQIFDEREDANGNKVFKMNNTGRGVNSTSDRYKKKKIQYVYKCKWIVGTDKCYDWGMCYDQKRSTAVEKKAKTKLSYHFCAFNFYEMKAQGYMERLIPYLDDYQLTMLKIQNFKNRAVPSGWWIDLDRLENVALTKGGKAMQPKELLQMFFETGVLVGRSVDAANNPMSGNVQPIIPISNTAAAELAMFYQDLVITGNTIKEMTGYNDITTGNPNPKTLVPGYEAAEQSTNDALAPMEYAETQLTQSIAYAVLCRMKQGIDKGKIEGYAPYRNALNQNTLRFISLDKGLLRDHGIELQKKTTDAEKQWIFSLLQQDITNGFLDISDAIMVLNTNNAKQAMTILAYRVKKAKAEMNKNEMAKIKLNNDGAKEAAAMAAQLTQQQKMMDYQHEERMEQMRIEGEIMLKKIVTESNERIAAQTNQTKMFVSESTAEGKVLSTDVAGVHQQQKQILANEAKKEPASTT